jgi:multidrug resistance protein
MGILLLLISFGTISAVVLTPALPQLSRDFGISEGQAQWTISIFLVGYAIGQLPYGPIANRFGRKKAIYIGICLMLVGSVLAISISSFWSLVLGRFIQALGSAVGLKITFTMISDLHEGKTATRAISFLSLAFALMPALGVAIGGYIVAYWGWRGCFVFLFLYAILLGFLILALPETHKQIDRSALQMRRILSGYLNQCKRRETLLNALLMGCVSSSFYIFSTLSPYVGINHIGLAPDQFGLWNLILCVGLIGGIGLTQWFAGRENPRLAIWIGILIMAFFALAMFLFFSFSLINAWTLFIPATLMRVGSHSIWSNASSSGLAGSHDKSNTSAVMQFVNLSTTTLGVFLVGFFHTTDMLILPSALVILSILLLAIWKKS